MKVYTQVFSAIAAAALLALLVSTASAGRLETSSSTFRLPFRRVDFREPFGSTIECAVTLEGSLHSRTIVKNTANLIGYITAARLGACANTFKATILTETLPWHVRYLSFSGTLPNITNFRINVIGAALSVILINGVGPCLLTSTVTEPLSETFGRNTATGELTEAELGGRIRTTCLNITMTFSSSRDRPTVLNGTAAVTVRLI